MNSAHRILGSQCNWCKRAIYSTVVGIWRHEDTSELRCSSTAEPIGVELAKRGRS